MLRTSLKDLLDMMVKGGMNEQNAVLESNIGK